MSSACTFIFMQIKVIFIRMVSHLDSLWDRGTTHCWFASEGFVSVTFKSLEIFLLVKTGCRIHDRFSFQGRLVACARSRQISDLWKARSVDWLNTALILISRGAKSVKNRINEIYRIFPDPDDKKNLAAATLRSIALSCIEKKGPKPPKTLLKSINKLKKRYDNQTRVQASFSWISPIIFFCFVKHQSTTQPNSRQWG